MRRLTLASIDTAPTPTDRAPATSLELDKDRIAWEAAGIAEADAELGAGLYVDVADVRAWVDSLRTDTPLPLPPVRHP